MLSLFSSCSWSRMTIFFLDNFLFKQAQTEACEKKTWFLTLTTQDEQNSFLKTQPIPLVRALPVSFLILYCLLFSLTLILRPTQKSQKSTLIRSFGSNLFFKGKSKKAHFSSKSVHLSDLKGVKHTFYLYAFFKPPQRSVFGHYIFLKGLNTFFVFLENSLL